MASASPQARQRAGTPEVDLRRVAADLDHVRALGNLGTGRLRSLAIGAAILRELADVRERIAAQIPAALAATTGEGTGAP